MRNRGMVSIALVLFAVLALSATAIYAEEQKSCAVLMHGTGSMPEADDFAVSDNCEEIAYDDGSAEECWSYLVGGGWGRCLAVHFTRSDNYETLKTARFNIMRNSSVTDNSFNWSVLNWTGTKPGSKIASGTITPTEDGWQDVDVGCISVPEDFVIAMHWRQGHAPCLWADINSPTNRSWDYPWSSEGYPWNLESEKNYMIRAVCDGAPDINVTPDRINASLNPGESVDRMLVICNDGSGDLVYNISIAYDTDGKAVTEQVGSITAISPLRGTAVSESIEIRYDDGEADDGISSKKPGAGMAVHFTSPDPANDVLETAKFYLYLNDSAPSNSFDWSVLEWTGTAPGSEIASGTTIPKTDDSWYDVDMDAITVPEDFVIAMYWKQGFAPYLGYDDDAPTHNRSLLYNEEWYAWQYDHDLMMRAVMGDDGNGEWLSVNKTSGTVASDDKCDKIAVTIDATGLAIGDYSAEIVISSNDPDEDENPVVVPVSLRVVSATTVTIDSANVSEGSNETVPINITDVADLCGVDIWLSYDSSVVVVDDISKGNLGPIAHNISNDPGVTKMAWDSTEGVTGNFILAYVTLTAVGSGGSVSPLDLAVNELYDSSLGDIVHNVVNGTFEVTIELMEGDVNMDGCVSLKDSTAIKLNLVGRMDLNDSQLKCADTRDDGKVNLKDSTFIRQWLVDPSTPLWQSPEDNDMGKPIAC